MLPFFMTVAFTLQNNIFILKIRLLLIVVIKF